MKRVIMIILAFIALGAVMVSGDTTYSSKNVRESITVSAPVLIPQDQYLTVDLDHPYSLLSKTGEPVLPVVRKVFVLPLGSRIDKVEVSLSPAEQMVLSKQLLPGPEPVPKTGGQVSGERVKKSDIYNSDEVYPARTFDYSVGTGIRENGRAIILTIDCYPVRYSPLSNVLHYSRNIDINVTFREPTVPVSFPDAYDMVIIAPSLFADELQPLIDHKCLRGVQTTLKATEDIYTEYPGRDDPEKIKYFIKDAIETWGVDYVLLVGGAAQLPCRYTNIYFEYDYQDYWVFPSDLYYADVYDDTLGFSSWDSNDNDLFAEYNWDGNYDQLDLYPDVYLGRLACVDESQVVTCVNKIITYEANTAYGREWFVKLVLIGGDSLPGDEEEVDEGEYVNQHVADTLDQFIPIRVWASNGGLDDADNISDAINDGAGFVFFNGHGNTTVWATHPHESYQWIPPGNYTNYRINALVNGDMLPIVVSDACYHCQYDHAPHCFGWTFLTNPNGGAIAYLGGTDVDVSYGGEAIVTKGIERLCVIMSTNYEAGDSTFGELWSHGVIDYISPVMDEIDYITLEEFEPFGDPSLVIRGTSQRPYAPAAPLGETLAVAEEQYTYASSTSDPDGDSLCYLFDWGDNSNSGWIGPFGSGDTAEASHQWAYPWNYGVRVQAKDGYGMHSFWSEPCSIYVCESRGNVNGDEILELTDAIFLLNYLFKLGDSPNPYRLGDCNCDEVVDVSDAIFLLNYLFRGGSFPCC